MLKKFLMIVGILLFLGLGGIGTKTFLDRHTKKQLIPSAVKTSGDPEADETTPKNTVPSFNKSAHSITDPSSIWVVANKTRPLNPKEYAPTDLSSVGSGQQMRADAATALAALIAAAKTENLTIIAVSGYRSYNSQVGVYNNEVQSYGQATADTESARPGYSEHQTGWAVDVGGGGCNIDDCFANTAEGKWVATNAYKYGFIVRYPADKVNVTGYRYEPWHIRYIGVDLSAEMHKQTVTTLEEFFGLPSAPDYK